MVCFPYAGGNSNFYKAWDFKDTEIVLVELPGRNACVRPHIASASSVLVYDGSG
jgi:surfactin synthase thioesterase subunit